MKKVSENFIRACYVKFYITHLMYTKILCKGKVLYNLIYTWLELSSYLNSIHKNWLY